LCEKTERTRFLDPKQGENLIASESRFEKKTSPKERAKKNPKKKKPNDDRSIRDARIKKTVLQLKTRAPRTPVSDSREGQKAINDIMGSSEEKPKQECERSV